MRGSLLILFTLLFSTQIFSSQSVGIKIVDINDRVSSLDIEREGKNVDVVANARVLHELNSISKDFKSITGDFALKMINKLDNDKVLSGSELSTIDHMIRTLLIVTDKNLELGKIYFENQEEKLFIEDDLKRTKENLIWLGSYLSIFDLFVNAYDQFYSEGHIRRILKDIYRTRKGDVPQLKQLEDLVKIVNDKKYRKFLKAKVAEFQSVRIKMLQKLDPELTRLIVIVEEIEVTKNIRTRDYPRLRLFNIFDSIIRVFSQFTNFVSGFFGNVVGAVRWRHGYMYEHQWTRDYLLKNLKPLDIIAEKTPFALTDLFIPGHFGHIAMWIGTEEQLREVGMWNHPAVTPLHDDIRAGRYILESVRPGSRMISLEHFLEVDEVTVMREPNVLNDYDKYEKVFIGAIDQLGKKYDFNFDVHTLDKVVCSEVVYHAFGHINWPTAWIFGRSTITPDDVISLAFYRNNPVDLEFSIISNKKKEVRHISPEEMAKNLSFKLNKKSSKANGKLTFDKKKKVCKTVRRRNYRDHGPKWKYYRSCKTKYLPLTYAN